MKKEDMKFPTLESMQSVVKVINDASEALKDKDRVIADSPLSEVLTGSLGAGIGGAASFAALYGLGAAGGSTAGITSGLAAARPVIKAGRVAGIFGLAPSIVGLGLGIGIASALRYKQLKQEKLQQEKERMYQEAIKKQNAILKALREENNANKDRIDYLTKINIRLVHAIKDLMHDLQLEA